MSHPALPHDHGQQIEHALSQMPQTQDFRVVSDTLLNSWAIAAVSASSGCYATVRNV